MFAEFARIRKEIQKKVNNGKKDNSKQINILEYAALQQKVKKTVHSKKHPKTSIIPLKVSQVPFLKQQYL